MRDGKFYRVQSPALRLPSQFNFVGPIRTGKAGPTSLDEYHLLLLPCRLGNHWGPSPVLRSLSSKLMSAVVLPWGSRLSGESRPSVVSMFLDVWPSISLQLAV